MVELDWHVLLIQAISFLITAWVVKRFAWTPLANSMSERARTIQSNYEKAEQARMEAENTRRLYQERVDAADAQAQARINASIQRGEQRANEIVSEAMQQAQALKQRATEEIERERQKVMAEMRGQVAHLSVAIAGKIIDERLDEQKHRALVDDFINQLGSLS